MAGRIVRAFCPNDGSSHEAEQQDDRARHQTDRQTHAPDGEGRDVPQMPPRISSTSAVFESDRNLEALPPKQRSSANTEPDRRKRVTNDDGNQGPRIEKPVPHHEIAWQIKYV
jgi:hypothetical protein